VARWNGSRWASFRFPGEVRTYAAAVFSRTDVWAFGEIFNASSASSRPYVVRFAGRRWLRVPSPLVPQDAAAVAPNDIWMAATWTNRNRDRGEDRIVRRVHRFPVNNAFQKAPKLMPPIRVPRAFRTGIQ
jgi:hypothetical protein